MNVLNYLLLFFLLKSHIPYFIRINFREVKYLIYYIKFVFV